MTTTAPVLELRQATKNLFHDERLQGAVDRATGLAGIKDN